MVMSNKFSSDEKVLIDKLLKLTEDLLAILSKIAPDYDFSALDKTIHILKSGDKAAFNTIEKKIFESLRMVYDNSIDTDELNVKANIIYNILEENYIFKS